jgi:hypothetical protein
MNSYNRTIARSPPENSKVDCNLYIQQITKTFILKGKNYENHVH